MVFRPSTEGRSDADGSAELGGQPSGALDARESAGGRPWLRAVPGGHAGSCLGSQAMLHRVPSGSVPVRAGGDPVFALFLVAGSVELLAACAALEETLVELVRAPDLFFPAAVINRQPSLMRARVSMRPGLMMIRAEAFREAVASDHALCLAVLACQAAQFRRQIEHAKKLQLRSAEERVGCYSLRLAEDAPAGEPVQAAAREAPDRLAARHDARDVLARAGGGRAGTGSGSMASRPRRGRRRRARPLPARSADRRTRNDPRLCQAEKDLDYETKAPSDGSRNQTDQPGPLPLAVRPPPSPCASRSGRSSRSSAFRSNGTSALSDTQLGLLVGTPILTGSLIRLHSRDLVRPIRRTHGVLRHHAVGGGDDRAAHIRLLITRPSCSRP